MDKQIRSMITNYYTLFHLVTELHRELAGLTIHKVFSQHRAELAMSFVESSTVVLVGCEPSKNCLYLRRDFTRARKNSIDVLKGVIGARIEEVVIHPNDREITFFLTGGKQIIVQLFGSASNVLFTDNNRTVIDAFLKKTRMLGTKIEELHTKPNSYSAEDLYQHLTSQEIPSGDLRLRLKSLLPQFGNVLIQELLFRCGIDGTKPIYSLTESEISRILQSILQLISELHSTSSPRIYFDKSSPLQFSINPLHSFNQYHYQLFESISDGIQTYIGSKQYDLSFRREWDIFERGLRKELEQVERTLQKINAEVITTAQADEFELKGRLLMAHLHDLQKGPQEISVEDIVQHRSESVLITLDPHLNPARNAERYFEKAKKMRRTIVDRGERRSMLQQRIHELQSTIDELELVETYNDLKEFEERHRAIITSLGLAVSKSGRVTKKEPLPFRVFTVVGGFQVWVGKNSENNDLLTTRHTAKNDLWFHARNVSGSHAVLKIGTGKGEISTIALNQAGAIAAYYSKMKNSKLVAVTMCEGKYVRKPKGAPRGTVTVEREKTLFVKPGLPEQVGDIHR